MQIRSIKEAARRSLQDSNRSPIGLTFLFVLCLNVPYLIYNLLDAFLFANLDTASTGIGGFNSYAAYLALSTILNMAIGLFAGIWQCCYQNYTLNVSRGKEVSFRDFTAPLRISGKVFWLNLLIALYTALWALAFLFPVSFVLGLIAPDWTLQMLQDPDSQMAFSSLLMIPGYLMAYRYRLSFLILFDHEEWKASEAIACSNRLTYGYKGKLFRMDMSFLWYYIPLVAISLLLPDYLLAQMEEFKPLPYFVAVSLPLLLEIGFCSLFQARVKTADAHAYNCILQNAPVAPPPPTSGEFPVFPGPRDPEQDPPHAHSGLQDDPKDDGWHTYE